MGKSAARLKDIAEKTGFSVNTVSLALRGSPRIPDETRRQISEAAEQLNYLPNQVAKSLVLKETKSIGLILTDITNPVLTAVAQAVELELSKRGYLTLFATSNSNPELERKMIESFRARRADGMLVFPCNHRKLDHIRQLRARNYPVVLLVGDPDAGVDAVCMDERAGAFKAVSHLLENGHRRVAIFDGSGQEGNREKIDGYKMALAAADVAFDDALVVAPNGHDVRSGYQAMEALAARDVGATAVICPTDSAALGALRYCVRHGIRVPQDMAIFGFDNTEFGEHAVTALSSVNYDIGAITKLAIDRVISLINSEGDLPQAEVTQVEPDLVIRESTAPLSAD
ncbi:LacI family DNA-binding transcriptional regulator [Flavimaricola marinus]|uniref:Putative HTH-type transcriptional repressor ExuR n=1 Tax=Flavimaricola marinus TaxID=1819565 RepID=A0A238L9Z5_9RHOB|nr:LacI family DNA-binding transcriptional regulator [Flavimaricola marinus]SMY06235.1 putative HTH-type transcriptional repressor ExuR [Flavimaricola marinus]